MNTIKLTEKVQKQFENAGFSELNNFVKQYEVIYRFNEFPDFLKDFLSKCGSIMVSDIKSYESDVTNKLTISPEYAFFEYEDHPDEDYDYYEKVIGEKVFPFGAFDPDGYRIACDSNGKIYMLGDYIFRISENFAKGIEILITYDWSNGFYQLDEDTGEWIKNKKWDE
jgi:hypothetical protein